MNNIDPHQDPINISLDLAQLVQDELGENVYLCYQCIRCTAGCPVGSYFDWQPNQIMRAIQLGQEDIALKSQTPWLCASCQTCSTRCPQALDIPAIMDFLTQEALERGFPSPAPAVKIFNEAFMREINLWGRAYELGLMAEVKLRTMELTKDLDLGIKMLQKRKFPLTPHPACPPKKPKPLAEAAKSVAYYPGCSLHSTAPEFNISSLAVCDSLEIHLIEPKGWICCGSSAAHRSDPQAATDLPLTNLNLIEQLGFSEVTMPCAACFNRHKSAQYTHRNPKENGHISDISQEYQDSVQVNTLVETIIEHAGIDKIKENVKNSLENLKVVCYYGCLLTRPPEVTEAPNHENPVDMDLIMQALGAQVIDWSYKTSCCGAAHSLTRPDIVLDLSSNLIKQAEKSGADLIVVACPLCHMNLDARQFQMKLENPLPVVYFTQLMAIAFGLSEKISAIDKNLTDPRPILRKAAVI